ncbi:MAG: cyclic pyranopterin monophosphate synthase MoaC [Bacillota bacterium]|nr:cyclic pyranopterin monophosphate synthase MoaC [Bacillota bacterium]
MAELSHVDEKGRARMVDIGDKPDTDRVAVARARVLMKPETLAMIVSGSAPKGDVFAVARVAGIMAAKRTPELIPLCHSIPLASVEIRLDAVPGGSCGDHSVAAVEIEVAARSTGKTGVEMEALTAASVAALTIYDMCKAVDREMRVDDIRLVYKAGGKSGEFVRKDQGATL